METIIPIPTTMAAASAPFHGVFAFVFTDN
jgi:hypothetical protein